MSVYSANWYYDSRAKCNAIIDKEKRVLVSGCKNTVIPKGVEGIGAGAFSTCYGLTTLVVPEGVRTIGEYAFANCKDLRSVKLPCSLRQIEWGAFTNTSIEKVRIPENVDSMDNGIFSHCNSLTVIEVDKRNRHFQSYGDCNVVGKKKNKELIYGCSKSVIPRGVEIIGYSALRGTLIHKAVIPHSVREIAPLAFSGCNGLAELRVSKKNR